MSAESINTGRDGATSSQPGPTAPHVSICICTFRRPDLLIRLLEGVLKLRGQGSIFTCSCVVVDNDLAGSAREVADRYRVEKNLDLVYSIEPERNFALVRNHTLRLARGEFIAFVDDDEVPVPEWLEKLLETRERYGADGVLGPVRPYFDDSPPRWIVRGKLCDRPVHDTGMVMPWSQSRTGNVLIRRSLFTEGGLQFDAAFAKGGEDVDFFKRANSAGHRFVWCEEAPAYELVPPARLKKTYFLKRALLQGAISLKYAATSLTFATRLRIGAQSLLALLVYSLMIPFLFIPGFHFVMKYLIKWCHHYSRLLALFGIVAIKERNF